MIIYRLCSFLAQGNECHLLAIFVVKETIILQKKIMLFIDRIKKLQTFLEILIFNEFARFRSKYGTAQIFGRNRNCRRMAA